MPTSTFQEQGTVTLVASVDLHVDYVAKLLSPVSEERRCQSRPGRACVLDGSPRHSVLRARVRCFELLRLELCLIVFHNDMKKDIAPVSSSTSTSSGFWS